MSSAKCIEAAMDSHAKKLIAAFKLTPWWEPTVRRKAHLDACDENNCPELIEPFVVFVTDVMGTPEDKRDDLLQMTALEPYVPFQRYPAYVEPLKSEQKLELYSAAMGRKLR